MRALHRLAVAAALLLGFCIPAVAQQGSIAVALPTATSSSKGIVQPDNSTITISGGVISSVGGGGCTFANPSATIGTSANNGSATTCMRSDASPAIPQASSSTFGAVKVDGTTITASAGVISAVTGGTGTVTNVATGACLTGGPITSTGTISGSYVINAQTGTTYTVVAGDACELVTFSNASSIAVTLPQATGSFGAGFSFDVQNKGAGLVTITPTTSTLNGASTLTVAQNTGCTITSDGTNWQISACTAKVSGTGTVTSITCNAGLTGGAITTSGTCALDVANANTWSGVQTFNSGKLSATSPAFAGTVTGNNTVPLAILAQSAANTMNGNWTGSTANVTANAMPSCADSGTNHLNYVNGTGITCGTAGIALSGTNIWTGQQTNSVQALSISTATFTPDGTKNNYSIGLTAACTCTIANPSATPVAGTSGIIEIDQYSGGAKTVTWGSQYYAAGGSVSVQPDTTASSINLISYYVVDATHIVISAGALNVTH